MDATGRSISLSSHDSDHSQDELPNPQTPETYHQIVAYEGLTAGELLHPGEDGEGNKGVFRCRIPPDEYLIRLDLASTIPKAAWSGKWFRDWWCMNRNFIPYIVICFECPEHPFDKRERCVVLIVEMFWVLMVACWAASAVGCVQCDMVCSGTNATATQCFDSDFGKDMIVAQCCSLPVEAATWLLENANIGQFNIGGALFTSVLDTFYALVTYEIMKCGCVQKKKQRTRLMIDDPVLWLYSFRGHCTVLHRRHDPDDSFAIPIWHARDGRFEFLRRPVLLGHRDGFYRYVVVLVLVLGAATAREGHEDARYLRLSEGADGHARFLRQASEPPLASLSRRLPRLDRAEPAPAEVRGGGACGERFEL